MTAPNDGTLPPSQEPPVTGPSAQAEPPNQQQPPASPDATATPPQLPAEVQAKLEQAEKRIADLDRIARQNQSLADQYRNQVQALAGVQAPQDPLQPYVERFKKQHGLEDDSAKILASIAYESDQRFNNLQQTMQANQQVPSIVNRVLSENGKIMQYPAAVQAMNTALQNAAATGNYQCITPEFAKLIAYQAIGEALMAGNGAAPTAPPNQMPNIMSQFGPMNGFGQAPMAQPAPGNQVPSHIAEASKAELEAVRKLHNLPSQQQ